MPILTVTRTYFTSLEVEVTEEQLATLVNVDEDNHEARFKLYEELLNQTEPEFVVPEGLEPDEVEFWHEDSYLISFDL